MAIEIAHNEFLKYIGVNIARARHLKGEKENSVALAIGVSQTVISKIERGNYPGLKITMVKEIAAYLKVPISTLLPPD